MLLNRKRLLQYILSRLLEQSLQKEPVYCNEKRLSSVQLNLLLRETRGYKNTA